MTNRGATELLSVGLVKPKVLINLIRDTIGDPHKGCEVGVWAGGTSRLLLETFSKLHLLMVDRYQPYAVGGKRKLSQMAVSGDFMRGLMVSALDATAFAEGRRSLVVSDSPRIAPLVGNGVLDFVFIDGDHFYGAVRTDIEAWYPKVRVGGLVCGHDYGNAWDRRGVWGVKQAVDEFAKRKGFQVGVTPGRTYIWWFAKG